MDSQKRILFFSPYLNLMFKLVKHYSFFFILMVCLLPSFHAFGQTSYFEYSERAKKAYNNILSLKFKEAAINLAELKSEEPENLVIHHLENYVDFLKVFINEEETEFKRLEKNKQIRLNKIKQGPEDSPYYLFMQAEIQLQWALARLKFEEYLLAFTEVSKAYKQLNKNLIRYPDFIGNKKSLGIIHALVGTIPENYRWSIRLLGGMDGSISQGKGEIEEVLQYAADQDFLFEEETLFMYTFLLLHLENEGEQAWNIVNTTKLNTAKNPLACFAKANVAMRTGRSEIAINILENRPKGERFHPFHYLDLVLGMAKLYRLDEDADVYIEKYIDLYRGKNYLKEAHQKLAWHYLILGNEKAYLNNMKLCLNRGDDVLDSDKTAEAEAKSGQIPNPTLLKARLLFDGGYYERAFQYLDKNPLEENSPFKFKLEYTYRLGRILHRMDHFDDALENYKKTITEGKTSGYFYACNAALQCGLIYEKEKEYDLAKKYFLICTSMKPDSYKTSLHQKAETGLQRLDNIGL